MSIKGRLILLGLTNSVNEVESPQSKGTELIEVTPIGFLLAAPPLVAASPFLGGVVLPCFVTDNDII